jgi:ectoine hydroxylase-related dioxygenase (phytanoyl-CoA dioxygenase family)
MIDSAAIAGEIARAGFAVVPHEPCDVRDLYDRAVEAADPADRGHGASCTRVWDFVNRGCEFDRFWLDPLLLAVCELVLGGPLALSTFHARAVRPGGGPQSLHVDRDHGLVGFVWMVDEFTAANGATRFVSRSGGGEAVAAGPRGSLVVYDGGVLHGYGANRTSEPRRSLQGAFVPRGERPGFDLRARVSSTTRDRLPQHARELLGLA